MSDVEAQLRSLRDIIRGYGSVLLAFSGGVDSALVLAVACEQLGSKALACIGDSPSFPRREMDAALRLAERIGAPVRIVRPDEHHDSGYVRNGPDRCFFCKSALFLQLSCIARTEGWNIVVDGVHLDDAADHVHGSAAARASGVRSPLLEAGLNKSNVRELARKLSLPVWDKPSSPCLASRIPHGTPVTSQALAMIERAEDALLEIGFRQLRVRHHGELARIEVPVTELDAVLRMRERIIGGVRNAGYRHVTLDLCGLREEFTSLTVGKRAIDSLMRS